MKKIATTPSQRTTRRLGRLWVKPPKPSVKNQAWPTMIAIAAIPRRPTVSG